MLMISTALPGQSEMRYNNKKSDMYNFVMVVYLCVLSLVCGKFGEENMFADTFQVRWRFGDQDLVWGHFFLGIS